MKEQYPILKKKLMIPKVSGFFVERKKLCDVFDISEENIFILSSRAGTGKTNAVAQYCNDKEDEVLWYTFDKSDNDEEIFLEHFIYGISKMDKQAGERLRDGLEDSMKLSKNATKISINILLGMAENKHTVNKKMYIVFDGFQCIVNQNILNMVKMLLEYLSGEIKVFILTSASMQRCFSRYMAEGNYRKITERELCFSYEEIRKMSGLYFDKKQIKKEYIQKIEELTENWPVAVGYLLQFMDERDEELSKVIKMSKKNLLMETMLYDYIYSEIYEKFSQKEREFLNKTAILQEMDASFCNSCLNREDSGMVLRTFWKNHVLELFWEKEREYFRYFELFQLFLLEQGEKKMQKEMGARASIFYQNMQQFDKAIFYAKNDKNQMSDLFERCGKKILQENRLDLIKQCIKILHYQEHEFSVLELEIAAEYFYRSGAHEQMEQCLNCADSMFGKENKYGMYRSLYRALFHYEENTEKYEKQINNVLFFLEESKIEFPYLLDREQKVLNQIMREKSTELNEEKKKKIKVSAFGTFQAIILEDGKELSWRTKKGCELFAYLLDRNGEAVERKTLLSELWSSELPNNAVAMLHNMFYNMRKELSYYNLEHIIQYKNKKYSLDVSLVQSDLNEMQIVSKYVEGKNIEKLEEYKHLFQTYKGRYLEDMDNEWIRGKQEHYEKIFEKGCCLLAGECMVRNAYEQALVYLKNALTVSVYSEKIVSMILQCYHKMGDLKGAKKQYEEFCILLKEELNLIPGEDVQKSYQECMLRQ